VEFLVWSYSNHLTMSMENVVNVTQFTVIIMSHLIDYDNHDELK